MRVLVSCVSLLLIVATVPIRASAQEKPAADDLFSRGKKLYDAGKYQWAADTFALASASFTAQRDTIGIIRSRQMLGECYANLGQCDKAIAGLRETLELALSTYREDHPEVAKSYYYLSRAVGGCARRFDEAISLMHKSIDLTRKAFGEESPELALNFNFLGFFFNHKDQLDSAIFYLDKALAIRKTRSTDEDIELSHVLANLGNSYEKKSELGKALELHLEALRIRQSLLGEDHPTVSNSITSVGTIYQKFGNYERALDYFRQGLEIRKRTLGPEHPNVAASYYTIGNVYGAMFNYHESLQYISQGNRIVRKNPDFANVLCTYLAYAARLYGHIGDHKAAVQNLNEAEAMAKKSLTKDHPYLAVVYNIAGEYYADVSDFEKSDNYLRKAIAIYQKAYGPGSVREADAYSKMGWAAAAQEKYQQALSFYEQALTIYDSKMGTHNPKSATMNHTIADALVELDSMPSALGHYRRAFTAITSASESSSDPHLNPPRENVENKFLALKIASSKAVALGKLATAQSNDIEILKRALDAYQYAVDLVDDVSEEYHSESGRLELEGKSRAVYTNSIKTAYRLYQLTGDRAFAEIAFGICGRSKSHLLLDNMKDDRAKTLGGVPDSLVEKERDIKIELAYHRGNLYQAQAGNNAELIAFHEKNVFEADQRLRKLKERLEATFPSYYSLKYDRAAMTVKEVQDLLGDQATAIVEYFVGTDVIYRFSISDSDFLMTAIEAGADLRRMVSSYEKSLSDAAFIMNDRQHADSLYANTANALYNILLKDVVDGGSIRKLIIVPDQFLAQLNFTTLLCEPPKRGEADYQAMEFLARRCRVSYAYSTYLIRNRSLKRNFTDLFAGFAPSYSQELYANVDTTSHPLVYLAVRDGLLPLPGAQEEVRRISDLMGGKTWLELDATETNFKTHASNFGILHLAMHSLLDNENPDFSELLFNPRKDEKNDGYLSIAEIYNLRLNAQLVVLSACSSGYGKIREGEGPITISRAFSYAGCPSVVMSLWKIPDAVTTEIMTAFYEELSAGKTKDEALRQAQLRFLNNTDDPLYHHPYFWAGFVVMGDTSPLPSGSALWLIYAAAGLAGITMILFIIRRKKSYQRAS